MAKTDDPFIDMLNHIDSLKQENKRLEENIEHIFRFIQAINAFLHEQYPHQISEWNGVVSWHNKKIQQEQEKTELEEQITNLEAKGFVIVAKSSGTEEAALILDAIRQRQQQRLGSM